MGNKSSRLKKARDGKRPATAPSPSPSPSPTSLLPPPLTVSPGGRGGGGGGGGGGEGGSLPPSPSSAPAAADPSSCVDRVRFEVGDDDQRHRLQRAVSAPDAKPQTGHDLPGHGGGGGGGRSPDRISIKTANTIEQQPILSSNTNTPNSDRSSPAITPGGTSKKAPVLDPVVGGQQKNPLGGIANRRAANNPAAVTVTTGGKGGGSPGAGNVDPKKLVIMSNSRSQNLERIQGSPADHNPDAGMPKPTSIGSKSANFVVGIDSNPLAPPKLNIGLSQSSISSRSVVLQTPSTQPPGWNIPLIAANLNQNNLPPWLSRLISLADQIPSTLRNAYSAIEEREAARLRPASKYIASHYATKVCHNSQNTRRNRYSDIIPYDRNRVVLKYPIAPDLADYINASYITAPYNVRSYIATQGPKPQTSCDFWQMVWEQNTAVIVMLTQEEEKGRTKCHRYWPDASESVKSFPSPSIPNTWGLDVSFLSEESLAAGEIILRVFNLTLTLGGNLVGKSRKIWQLHFLAWPDHRVSNPTIVLTVIDFFRYLQKRAHLEYAGLKRSGNYKELVLEKFREKGLFRHADSAGSPASNSSSIVENFSLEQFLELIQDDEFEEGISLTDIVPATPIVGDRTQDRQASINEVDEMRSPYNGTRNVMSSDNLGQLPTSITDSNIHGTVGGGGGRDLFLGNNNNASNASLPRVVKRAESDILVLRSPTSLLSPTSFSHRGARQSQGFASITGIPHSSTYNSEMDKLGSGSVSSFGSKQNISSYNSRSSPMIVGATGDYSSPNDPTLLSSSPAGAAISSPASSLAKHSQTVKSTPSIKKRSSFASFFGKRLSLNTNTPTPLNDVFTAGPPILHCSAGCGRTGTLMTIDIVLALLNNPSVISDYQPSAISPAVLSSGMKKAASVAEARSATTTPTPTTILSFASSDAAAKDSRGIVYNYHQLLKNPESLSMQQDLIQLTVNVLREQRVSMVQTIEQYVFCYEAILTRFLQLKAKSRNYRHKQHKIYYSNASGKQESISSESGAISSTQSEPFLLPNIMSGLEAEEEKELGVSIASSSSHQHNHHNNFQHQLRHHHWQQQQQRQSSVSPSRKVSVWVAAGAETTSSDDAKSTMGIKETQSSKMGSSLAGGDAYSDEEAEVLSNMGYKETQSSKMGSSMAGGDDDDGESDGGEEMEVKSNMGLKDTQSSKIGSSMASRDENNDGGEEAEILSNMGYKETQSSKKANSEAGDVD